MAARETRRRIVLALAGAALAPYAAAQPNRVFKVGVLSAGSPPGQPGRWQALVEALAGLGYSQAAQKSGIQLPVVQFPAAADFERVLAQARRDGVEGIIHPLDGGTSAHRPALAQAAIKNGLPGIYWDVAYVEAGGLMTYSVSFAEQLRTAARYLDQLLRGAKAAELPVQQPSRVELVVNRKTAQALGIAIPPSIAVRADRVVD